MSNEEFCREILEAVRACRSKSVGLYHALRNGDGGGAVEPLGYACAFLEETEKHLGEALRRCSKGESTWTKDC